jgi:hypothetical protein
MVMGPDPSAQIAKDAGSAQTMGIASIIVGLCCCALIGLVLGVLAINKGNAVAAMIQQTGMGQQYLGKANTAKMCGIIGIVCSVINIIAGIILNVTGAFSNIQAQ